MSATPPSEKSKGFRFFPATWAGRCAFLSIAWGLLMMIGWLISASLPTAPPVNRPIKAIADDYVSADTCRSCHPGNYASWHRSYHRTMTQVANSETILAELDGQQFADDEKEYIVVRRGEKHFVNTKPIGSPESAYGNEQEIVLLTGSHHLQICWLATSDRRTIEQFPFVYFIAEQRWVPMADSFLVPPGLGKIYSKGDWNSTCINCHTTQGRSLPVSEQVFDSAVSDFGISCEACHSGGREHVALNRDPLRRYGLHLGDGSDQTIANPAKMSGPESSMVCGQCHSIWLFDEPAARRTFMEQNGKFRPGDEAMDLRWVVQPGNPHQKGKLEELMVADPEYAQNSFWGDGMVKVTGREFNGVTTSPCFKGGDFSCLSCHDMHPAKTDPASLDTWAVSQMGQGMKDNLACLQCHKDMRNNVTAHTRHAAGSPGSSCYNCHMPHTSFGLMRAIRSHRITSPTVRESLELGRPNACNLCHLDQPLGWTADKLTEWFGQERPALPQDDEQLSAGAKWILKGDAGQRGLIAWSMGWEPAQRAAGKEWFYPYLIMELNDPYSAVRYVAWKSLQSLPGFADFPFDYTAGDESQKTAASRAYTKWWQEHREQRPTYGWKTIMTPAGEFRHDTFDRLLQERDNRKIYLIE